MESKIEMERKFVLKYIPELDYDEIYRIDQYYLTDNVRFRREQRINSYVEIKYLCCTKRPLVESNPCINEENTFQIPREMYVKVFETGKFKMVTKIRHAYKYGGFIFEIDQFANDNLILLEVEYSSENPNVEFPKEIMDSIEREVTFDKTYKNYNLAK